MGTFKIIKGTFHVKGFQPDGDSIRFQADDQTQFDSFKFSTKSAQKATMKQLRLEAIDALETHYEGFHQPRSFGIGALEKLLGMLGIGDLQYSLTISTIVNASDGKPGFIATDGLDGFDRPISLVFPPHVALTDGAILTSAELPIEESVNFRMCRDGLVYPTFYTTTDSILVEKMANTSRNAREALRGIWVIDHSADFTIHDLRTVYEDILILPKLFRRLVSYFDTNGSFDGLPAYMKRNGDKLFLANGTKTTFDKIVTVEGRRLKLLVAPEDIFFVPKK